MGLLSNDPPTSSIWDRISLLSILTLFSAGTLYTLHELFPLSDRQETIIVADFEQSPDADLDADAGDGGDGDGD